MTTEFKCFVGLDWADKKHDVCIQSQDGDTRVFDVIQHTPESIDSWIISLHDKYDGQIAIASELDKGPIINALKKYSFVTLFAIPPLMLARYRQTFTSSGAKNDPSDAQYLLELLLNYPNKIKPISYESNELRQLRFLTEQRRFLVGERRRIVNRLINCLKQYYPQPLGWFDHRNTDLFIDFICRWPTLQKLQRARTKTIEQFFISNRCRSKRLIEMRLDAIEHAVSLTDDQAVMSSFQMLAVSLAQQAKLLNQQIREFDSKIKGLFQEMDDYKIFASLPGAGKCLAPRLLSLMGEKREKFNSANDVQCMAGIAPVTERSGQKNWVHWRWKCSKFNRQTFVEWAEKTIKYSYWAKVYYEKKRLKGSSHQCAVRSLAYKWIRILFRCWKNKTCYDEDKYLAALRTRSLLLDVA